MIRVCVKISFYIVNKPPYNRIRLIAAKENEGLKHVAYINYTLNELSQILGYLMFVDNCKAQYCFVKVCIFSNWNMTE